MIRHEHLKRIKNHIGTKLLCVQRICTESWFRPRKQIRLKPDVENLGIFRSWQQGWSTSPLPFLPLSLTPFLPLSSLSPSSPSVSLSISFLLCFFLLPRGFVKLVADRTLSVIIQLRISKVRGSVCRWPILWISEDQLCLIFSIVISCF